MNSSYDLNIYLNLYEHDKLARLRSLQALHPNRPQILAALLRDPASLLQVHLQAEQVLPSSRSKIYLAVSNSGNERQV